MPVPAILAEMFRSLNACRRAGEGRFIGCAQLLIAWFHSHFWKVDKVSVGALIGFRCLGFGEPLGMHLCWSKGNTIQDSLCRQHMV
ncbi:hypothetical protein Gotur_031736 [Gossypium turneri]